jgi:ApbE superfamily uncharacterized protein (UPF0280 family)
VRRYGYGARFYREWMRGEDLSRIRLVRGESDLLVLCSRDMDHLAALLLESARREIVEAISSIPGFRESLSPVSSDRLSSPLAESMMEAASAWNVGPMASVAGAVAQYVACGLHEYCSTVIVENGGDTFAYADTPLTFRIYPGDDSPFPPGFGFSVDASAGISVCTSSGSVGPSWSAGLADAVVAVAGDGAQADAAATSIANRVTSARDVEEVTDSLSRDRSLQGLVVMAGDRMGVWGELEITALKGGAGE